MARWDHHLLWCEESSRWFWCMFMAENHRCRVWIRGKAQLVRLGRGLWKRVVGWAHLTCLRDEEEACTPLLDVGLHCSGWGWLEPTADEDWECQRLQEAGEEIPASRHALGDIQAALPSPEPGLSSAHRTVCLSQWVLLGPCGEWSWEFLKGSVSSHAQMIVLPHS